MKLWQKRVTQGLGSIAELGCLVLLIVVPVISWGVIAGCVALSLSASLPIWAAILFGILAALAVTAICLALGGDITDLVVRLFVAALLLFILIPAISQALTNKTPTPGHTTQPND